MGVEDDVAVVGEAVEAGGGGARLVAHSYGGAVISGLGDHPGVARSTCVAAFWAPDGVTLGELMAQGPPAPWIVPGDDGAIRIGGYDVAREYLLADVDDTAARETHAKYVALSAAVFGTPIRAPEHTHPTSYVVCEQDGAVAPAAQEQMAQQADEVARLPSSHSPMLSMPGRLTEVLLAVG